PVPFPEDPYQAIRQTYLVETETHESPYTIASPTPLLVSTPPTHHAEDSVDSDTSGARPTSSDFTATPSPDHPLTHTTPTLVPFLCRNTRLSVRVPPAMSPRLSANIAEVAAMSNSAFLEDDEDEEVEDSLDSDSESEDAKDEGHTAEEEGPAIRDKGLAMGDEGPGMRVESLGLGGDAAVPEGQQQATPVVEIVVGDPLGLGQSSRSVPESERPKRVSALRQPTLTTWIDLEDDKVYIDVPGYPLPDHLFRHCHLLSGLLVHFLFLQHLISFLYLFHYP
ncbi:hypothetical protein Tco_0070196, partial [Tanacetum coccineum]